jgi:hypothetical protein
VKVSLSPARPPHYAGLRRRSCLLVDETLVTDGAWRAASLEENLRRGSTRLPARRSFPSLLLTDQNDER